MVFSYCSKERECRYCMEGGGIMVAPCKCSGHLKWVHMACLSEWHHKRDVYTCEICHGPFRVPPRIMWEMRVTDRVSHCLSTVGYLMLWFGAVWPHRVSVFQQWMLLVMGHVCVFFSVSIFSEIPLYRWLLVMHQWPVLAVRLVLCAWRPWHFIMGDILCIVVFYFVNRLAL